MRAVVVVVSILLLALTSTRVSAEAIRRRSSPKDVPIKAKAPRPTRAKGKAIRRGTRPKSVAKKMKSPPSPKQRSKGLKRPLPSKKRAILPKGRSKVKYDKNRRHRNGQVSVPADLQLDDTDEIDVQLFDVKPARSYKRKQNVQSVRDTVSFYYGESENELSRINLVQTKLDDGSLILVGSVHENGTVYQIRQLPNGETVVKSTRSKDFQPEQHQKVTLQDRIGFVPKPSDEVEGLVFASNSTGGRRLAEDGSVLDVMVMYTNNAMCAAASQAYGCPATSANQAVMEALINLAVEETNVAYRFSGIPTRLRLVHIHYEANYDDHANDWQTTLNSLHDANDGVFDYVPAMRRQYGADFVSMVIDSGEYCGLSFLPNPPTADEAYSLVLWSCATGYYSFGHELAHNMGCNHDRPDAGSAGLSGVGYNFGFQYLAASDQNDKFRTVLSYDCPGGCERVQRFSNPAIKYNGVALGTRKANNARWIRERLSIYANFMPAVISPSPSTISTPGTGIIRPGSGKVTGSSPSRSGDVLTTMFTGGLVGVGGNIFSVVAKNDLTVTNFAVHSYAATTVTVEVWKRRSPGGCKGAQRRRIFWERIGVTSFVASPSGQPSVLPRGSMSPVAIKAGDQQCFYVTFSGKSNYNRYSRGRRLGRTFKSNIDMAITEGYAVAYPFGDSLSPRMFNGQVFYRKGISSDASPTLAPTVSTLSPAPTISIFKSPSLDAISTTFEGGNGQAGNMFDVRASATLTVKALDVHTLATSVLAVRIYTKPGSLVGYENNSSAWTLVCSSRVQGSGASSPTHISEKALRPVTIEAGNTQAFYVTFTKAVIRYTAGNITSQNSDLQFLNSVGSKYPFGDSYPERIWNGNLYYALGSVSGGEGDGNAVDQVGISKRGWMSNHPLFTDETTTSDERGKAAHTSDVPSQDAT